VRFSKDKSPYKTNIGGHVSVQGPAKATEMPAALYFHVGHDRTFAAAGHYMMDPRALARYRAAVGDAVRGKELEKILARLDKKGFVAEAHETLQRVPKGYDATHPRAELLKRKGLVVLFPGVPKNLLTSPKLVAWLASNAKEVAPLVEWLVFA
jgi:uncharacterized protein (TIGR02453 family)